MWPLKLVKLVIGLGGLEEEEKVVSENGSEEEESESAPAWSKQDKTKVSLSLPGYHQPQ